MIFVEPGRIPMIMGIDGTLEGLTCRWLSNIFGKHLGNKGACVFFRGTCTRYVIHLFSMVSFCAYTYPNQLGVAAIDNADWFEHVFDR